jgi:murein endopeptidase
VVLRRRALTRWARRLAAALALAALLGGGWALVDRALDESAPSRSVSTVAHRPTTHRPPPPRLQRPRAVVPSRALGLPWRGRLVAGVRLPAEGAAFFTWDPIRKRSPNRAWRRWGTDRLVTTLLRVLREFGAAHPGAPRVGVGDLSRPRGGDFGPRFGGPGHASHQNGLDADVYYPRRDGAERSARTPSQVDRALAQDLVDRFVRAGAVKVFVGPHLDLAGDPSIVQPLRLHDNHLHVRLRDDGK